MNRLPLIGPLLPAAALLLVLSACGGTAESAAPCLMDTAQAKVEQMDSLDARMGTELDIETGGGTIETTTTVDMTCFREPARTKAQMRMDVEMSINMGKVDSAYMSVYAEAGEDGAGQLYLSDGANWYVQSAGAEELSLYDAQNSLSLCISCGSGLTPAGQEEIDGVQTVKYTGAITAGDTMREILLSAGMADALDALDAAGTSGRQAEELLVRLGEIPVSLWIDQTTSYPVRYEMELTALMNAIAGHLAEAAEAEGPEVCYTKTSVVMTCSNFNQAAEFTIPEAVYMAG